MTGETVINKNRLYHVVRLALNRTAYISDFKWQIQSEQNYSFENMLSSAKKKENMGHLSSPAKFAAYYQWQLWIRFPNFLPLLLLCFDIRFCHTKNYRQSSCSWASNPSTKLAKTFFQTFNSTFISDNRHLWPDMTFLEKRYFDWLWEIRFHQCATVLYGRWEMNGSMGVFYKIVNGYTYCSFRKSFDLQRRTFLVTKVASRMQAQHALLQINCQ
jgi:hypothetical protein